ncbi:MAG: hypothetical protein IKK44_04170 [Clostridium sp.]|nr:hypothetical protein [Clostridium sp.]
MKRQIRLYNVIFPIWMLWLFPQVWLVALPANLVIDCLVLLAVLKFRGHPQKKTVLKQVWWKLWLLGFAADFIGVAVLLPSLFLQSWLQGAVQIWAEEHLIPVLYNAFRSPWAFTWTLAAVVLAGVCIYFFDRRALRACSLLTHRDRHVIALTLAIATAPWLFFIPAY